MNKKIITFICYALMLLFAMFLTSVSFILPELSETYNLSPSQAGTIFTFNYMGFVLFVLIGGISADRFGKKTILSVVLIGFTVSLFLFPLTGSYYAACMVMLFLGGFAGLIESLACAIISDLNTENSTYSVNLLSVICCLGPVAGSNLINQLISHGFTWHISYYIFGSLSLLLTVLFIAVKFPQTTTTDSLNLASVKTLISSRKVILIGLCMIFYTGAEIGSWGWMNTYLKTEMKFSAFSSSIAMGIFFISMTIGRWACGPLILRYGTRKVVAWLASFSTIVILLTDLFRSEAILLIIIGLLGLAFSGQWGLISSYGSEDYKEISGTAYSFFIACGGLGGTIVPYYMGLISEKTNMKIAMMSPAILFLAIAIIFTLLKVESKKSISCEGNSSRNVTL